MPPKKIAVIGASAGGIEALRELVAQLPAEFPAPICVVLHTAPQSPGVLDVILSRAGPLPATTARDRERLQPAHIYVTPPDCHLVVEPGRLRVTKGPRENRFRPAVDPLFRSAAQVYGPNAIGVILTGSLDDGTAGLWTLKQLGGTAIVQHPDDALFSGMPRSAMAHVHVDHAVPLASIAALLVQLTTEEAHPHAPPDDAAAQRLAELEVKIVTEQNPVDAGLEAVGEPSRFACPDCHGVLLQLKEGGRTRFRCHTGHAYSVESLLASISEGIDASLWVAIRALEEGALLLSGMAGHLKTHHKDQNPDQLLLRAAEAHRHSDLLRHVASEREPLVAKG